MRDEALGRDSTYTSGKSIAEQVVTGLASTVQNRTAPNAAHRYLRSTRRRVLELVLTISAIAILTPVLVLVAVAVRLSSPGPVFFRQFRNGKSMAMFEMLKFRSMYWTDETCLAVKQAERDDPRITSVGKILRKTSLDELPQLINVIRGDMSLIGPRPHAIEHDLYYGELLPNYSDRFRVCPGITGLAQVSGARGATPHVDDMKRRIELDLLYMRNASLRLDLQILFRTMKEVFASDAAY